MEAAIPTPPSADYNLISPATGDPIPIVVTPVTTSPSTPLTIPKHLATVTTSPARPAFDTQKRCAGYNLISPANVQPITTEHTPVRTSSAMVPSIANPDTLTTT
jgi:hypothetical protein